MAGRPRLPEAVAKATGAMAKNPQRFTDRKEPKVGKLGPPPARLSESEAEAWNMLAEEIPWLASSDRRVVAMAARLVAKFEADELTMGGMTELRLLMTQLGATPAARSKVHAPAEKEENDPAADFLN